MTDEEKHLKDSFRAAASIRKLCAAMIEEHGIGQTAVSSAILGVALERMGAELSSADAAQWLRDAADAIEQGRDAPPPVH